MIDQFTYPQGDLQTWDESIGEDLAKHVPDDIARVLASASRELHLAEWRPSAAQLMRQRTLMIAGAIPANEELLDPKNRTVLRLRDKVSGLSFLPSTPLRLNLDNLPEEDAELLNAALARVHLHPEMRDASPNLFDSEEGIRQWLTFPIKECEADSPAEIVSILTSITQAISPYRKVRRLWLRGQRREYPETRNGDASAILPYGRDFPSLVPSLGRFAIANPGKVNFDYAFAGPSHWWKKPFLVWVMRQNPGWFRSYPALLERVSDSLGNPDDMVFSRILVDIIIDPLAPTEVDDLRQWFFAFYKYSAWIWVLQQYGYLASMLDITSDIDSALFFTQAQIRDGRVELLEPSAERVIYVFVEWESSCSFRDIERVDWGDADWARQLPPRVLSQRAGCLVGSTWFRQNYYGHLVIARIRLPNEECQTTRSVESVFPPPGDDLLLKTLFEARPTPQGLYW